MNAGDKEVLKRFNQKLVADISVDAGLLGGLFTEGVFEARMIEIIRSQGTSSERTEKLLELLPKRGPSAMSNFIKVIESTYPWLAHDLKKARADQKTQGCTNGNITRNTKSENSHITRNAKSEYSHITRNAKRLSIDRDIKQIVGTFMHRLLGQSKRIPENVKRSIETFLSTQMQEERNRYQRLLYPISDTPEPSTRSETPEEIFTSTEISEMLFSIHTKLEPFVLRECEPEVECDEGDGDGHPDYRNPKHGGHERQPPKRLSCDMSLPLIHKEIDFMLGQMDSLNGQVKACLQHFDSTDCSNYSLDTLVGNVVSKCEALDQESTQDRVQIRQLLDKADEQFDTITQLQDQCDELKKQINAVYAEKGLLMTRIKELERRLVVTKQQQQQIRDSHQNGLGSKSTMSTPRGEKKSSSGSNSISVPGRINHHGAVVRGGSSGGGGEGGGATNWQFVNRQQRLVNNHTGGVAIGSASNKFSVSTAQVKQQMTRRDKSQSGSFN